MRMGYMDFALEDMMDVGGSFADSTFPTIKQAKYDKNRLYIGRNKFGHDNVYFDFSQSLRAFFVAPTRGGKTYLVGSIMDRAHKAGMMPVILTDLKGEYYTRIEPNSGANFLMPNEWPTGLPIRVFYPTFFEKLYPGKIDLPFAYEPFNISLESMNIGDLTTLMSTSLSQEQRMLLESVYENGMSVEDLRKNIANNSDYLPQTKQALINSINNMLKWRVIGYDYASFVDVINQGFVPVLCIAGYDKVPSFSYYMSAYIAIILRDLMDAKRRGLIKQKLIVIIEETPQFTLNEESSGAMQINQCCTVGAQYGISMFFIVQFIDDRGRFDKMISNSRYVLCSHNLDLNYMAEPFKRLGIIDYKPQTFKSDVDRIKRHMRMNQKTKNRDWLLLDRDSKRWKIFLPFSSLSKHCEER